MKKHNKTKVLTHEMRCDGVVELQRIVQVKLLILGVRRGMESSETAQHYFMQPMSVHYCSAPLSCVLILWSFRPATIKHQSLRPVHVHWYLPPADENFVLLGEVTRVATSQCGHDELQSLLVISVEPWAWDDEFLERSRLLAATYIAHSIILHTFEPSFCPVIFHWQKNAKKLKYLIFISLN